MIFNVDETACFNNTDSVKIRVVTTEKIKNPIRKIPKSRFHITAVCTIADDGTYLPTLILDKRKTVERNFVDNFSTVPLSFVFSESGYMNQNLFHLFITSILLPNIRQRRKKIGKNAKALLILDNAPSHYNSESIKICKKNLIQILFLPSNSTDFLQPLDVGCFKAFKSYIKRQLIDGTYESFLSTIRDGLQVSLTLKNIRNSFKTCGITPYETLVELPNNTPIAKPKKTKKKTS
ncbi:tigger transposable element-derived protein [Anaeramoeba flamelloides]|uniref:Tigger transposable element-derived protein n=1 Tax=Anaeramoeba flamelloides TaxID=1746091 RepID=A0AAV7Y7I4_9EUKA|nr:tigger transposable element-derived protein [Anaeramoeba flamelloides]